MKNYVYIILDDTGYMYDKSDTTEMCVLGFFLASDVGSSPCISFIDWVKDNDSHGIGGNVTYLEKKDGFIFLSNEYLQEEAPTEIKIPQDQFLNILLEWEEKICKEVPKEVILRQENGKFFFETKNCVSIVLNKNPCAEKGMKDYICFKLDVLGYAQRIEGNGMYILGRFLTSDFGLSPSNSFIDWVKSDECSASGNLIHLKKEDFFIVLSDLYSDEKDLTEIKVPTDQFLNILLEWKEKICKEWPKNVILRQENGNFFFEKS